MAVLLPLPGTVGLLARGAGRRGRRARLLLGARDGAAVRRLGGGGPRPGLAFGLMNLAWAGGQVVGGGAGGALADVTADACPTRCSAWPVR